MCLQPDIGDTLKQQFPQPIEACSSCEHKLTLINTAFFLNSCHLCEVVSHCTWPEPEMTSVGGLPRFRQHVSGKWLQMAATSIQADYIATIVGHDQGNNCDNPIATHVSSLA